MKSVLEKNPEIYFVQQKRGPNRGLDQASDSQS